MNSVTRGKIHVETEGRHRSLTAMEGDPVIIINPSLAGSWFTTPKPIFPDTVGYWSRHTKFPGSSDTTHVPYDFRNLTPIKFTFHIEDDDLKTFLSPTKWTDKGGYICLSSEVFESASYHVPASNTCPTVDKCLRAQLTDNLITDELIDITEKLVNLGLNIPRNNPGASDDHLIDLLVNNLELIGTSVILSAASNLRGRPTILAI